MQIQTVRDGILYILTFRSESERFEKVLPTFKAILAGFAIRPAILKELPKSTSPNRPPATSKTIQGVKFQPSGSEYYVIFPSNPETKVVDSATPQGQRIQSISAELVIEKEKCLLRAEFVPMPNLSLETLEDQALSNGMHQYAESNGIQFPQLSVGIARMGKYVKLRGYKDISGIKFTIETMTYYGRNSIMSLSVSGPSKEYPSTSVMRFLDSIGK